MRGAAQTWGDEGALGGHSPELHRQTGAATHAGPLLVCCHPCDEGEASDVCGKIAKRSLVRCQSFLHAHLYMGASHQAEDSH